MVITTDRLAKLTRDTILGEDPKPKNAEEAKYIKDLKKENEQAKKDGVILTIPSEWPE